MPKKISMILTVLYLGVMIYYAIFNWGVFTLSLNIDLGFTAFKFPLILGIFLLGLVFLLIEYAIISYTMLRNERDILKVQNELEKLKLALQEKETVPVNELDRIIQEVKLLITEKSRLSEKSLTDDSHENS